MSKTLIDRVIEQAGGRDALMRSLGVSKQTISDWKRWGHVSAKRAPAVEKLTGIPRTELCPDFDWDGTKTTV
jgi:DNA-binding transcriptional regulator YdaS (Cro superfamily)